MSEVGNCRLIQYEVTDIEWETDGQKDVDLPNKITVSVPACADEIEYITDYLSDVYGFLHKGYEFKKKEGA